MRLLSRSADETLKIAEALGRNLVSGDTVLLYGELGAGKSVFARGCARGLGVRQAMASPSFTLMQPYRGDREEVYHFDLYRLSGPDELYFSGLEEHIGGEGVALIEWPQMGDVKPEKRISVEITRGSDDSARVIDLELFGMDDRAEAIYSALSPFETDTEKQA